MDIVEDIMENIGNIATTVFSPDGKKSVGQTKVISEHVLTVIINSHPVYRLVCTRCNLRELVAGRLLTDGFIEKAEDIAKISFSDDEDEAEVILNADISWKETIVSVPSSCAGSRTYSGNGRSKELKKLPDYKWEPKWVFELAEEFKKGTGIHEMTSGSHACILAREGKTLYICEDIGRHNAVDKAVGYALLNNITLSECMLFTSGRVPVDMVGKIVAAGIPVLVSKSVPTMQSVKLAEDYNLVLIGRTWPDQFEVF